MIFVYPALVSNTVDKKIAPTVCKALEQFFLLHLAESFTSGTLRIKTVWDTRKDTYGSLVLENKKAFGKVFLSEVSTGLPVGDEDESQPKIKAGDEEVRAESQRLDMKLSKYLDSVSKFISGQLEWNTPDFSDIHSKDEADARLKIIFHDKTELKNIYRILSEYSSKVESIVHKYKNLDMDSDAHVESMQTKISDALKSIEEISKQSDMQIRELQQKSRDPSLTKDEKGKSDQDKYEAEKNKEKLKQYETHGSYKVEVMKGVSFKPTMMELSVKVQYVGGPHQAGGVSTAVEFQSIPIGCKVLPMSVETFGSIENAILSDYFTTPFQTFWISFYRKFQRGAMSIIQKLFHVNLKSKMDPVKSDVLMAPQGYINASSFQTKSSSASFYNYSSAIVIFNKDDIMHEDGENFFLNRDKLNSMFKMGWNSFCILDPVKEEAMFITALDGGYLHVIPYSYLFHSMGMEDIYKNLSDLQRRTPIFRMKMGKFSNLISRLKRESALKCAVLKSILTERKNAN